MKITPFNFEIFKEVSIFIVYKIQIEYGKVY